MLSELNQERPDLLLEGFRKPTSLFAIAPLFRHQYGFPESDGRSPLAMDAGRGGPEHIFLKLVQELAQAFDAWPLVREIFPITEELHHQIQVIQFNASRPSARIARREALHFSNHHVA
jgi:hypothetical protein